MKTEKLLNGKMLASAGQSRKVDDLVREAGEAAKNDEESRRIMGKIAASSATLLGHRQRLREAEAGVDEAQRAVDGFDADLPGLNEERAALDKMEQEAVRDLFFFLLSSTSCTSCL